MNLLLLECAIELDEEILRELDRRGHRVVRHGFDAADRSQNIDAILAKMPQGFRPDAIVCWSVDYHGIPEGIERADAFTIAQVNDFHLAFSLLRPHLRRFDAIWTDASGVEVFRREGIERFVTSPLYSYGAGVPQIEMPAKDLDLVFVGGMNHAIHRERGHWLRRMARLADRHKVLIASGVYGKDYLALLARAKIAFNHSVRGEMNLRCFEAPMLGAMPMLERANREAPFHFPDGMAHAYYDEKNFEEKVSYYLARPQERERVAANAREIASRMRREQLAQAIEQIEPLLSLARKDRSWHSVDPAKRILAAGTGTLYSGRQKLEGASRARIDEALSSRPQDPEALCAQGYAGLLEAGRLQGGARTERICLALGSFERAVAASPSHLPARISLAWWSLETRDWVRARRLFAECLALTSSEDLREEDLDGLFYPVGLDEFRMARERILASSHGDPERRRREQALLFRLRASEGMAMTLAAGGEGETALAHLREALRCSVALGDPDPRLFLHAAAIAWGLGEDEEAIALGERYERLAPLDFEFWEVRLNRLLAARRFGEVRRRAEEYAVCAGACTAAQSKEEAFRKTAAMIRAGENGFLLWEEAAKLDREGRHAEAEQAYRRAQPLCSGASTFALDYGSFLVRIGKPEQALPWLDFAKSDPATQSAAAGYEAEARSRLASNQAAPSATATTKAL